MMSDLMDSLAVAPLAPLECSDGPEQIYVSESGPVDIGEIEFGVGHLPQQEARYANLPRCPEHEVGIGDPVSGDVSRDHVLVDLRYVYPAVNRILCNTTHRIGDVLPPAVGYGHVQEAVVIALGTLGGVVPGLQDIVGEQVHVADNLDADVLLMDTLVISEVVEGLLEEVHQVIDLRLRPVEVLGGERIHREYLHTKIETPVEDLLQLLSSQPVALHGLRPQHLLGVATVPVHYDGDMPGDVPT